MNNRILVNSPIGEFTFFSLDLTKWHAPRVQERRVLSRVLRYVNRVARGRAASDALRRRPARRAARRADNYFSLI